MVERYSRVPFSRRYGTDRAEHKGTLTQKKCSMDDDGHLFEVAGNAGGMVIIVRDRVDTTESFPGKPQGGASKG